VGTVPLIVPPRRVAPLLLLALLTACPRGKGAPIRISHITVSESTLADNPALAMTALDFRDRLVRALDRTGRFVPLAQADAHAEKAAGDKKGSWRCRAELSFTRESDEPLPDGGVSLRRAETGVGLQLAQPDSEVSQLHADATGMRLFDPAVPSARTAAFRGALDVALGVAAAQLVVLIDAAGKSDEVLIADLESPDGGVRDAAVRQLADRKNPAAVPALIDRLKDSDRQVVLRAMGALEELRDQRAVRPLIDLTERQDAAFVAQVVYVIGAIGGADAEAFLYTLQNGSPDAQVRVAATEAGAELRRRRAAGGKESKKEHR
jgi:hypothetical protein